MRDRVSTKDVEAAVHGLAAKGCISLYKVGGKSYFWFPTWSEHQRIQTKKPKYPSPDEGDDFTEPNNSTVSHGESPPESNPNPIQSESKYESESNDCAETENGSAPVISLPLNDGSVYSISEEQCQEWAGLYPAVDVIQQLRGMKGWLISNPSKRKTSRGILKFVNGWLCKEQDKGGTSRGTSNNASNSNNSSRTSGSRWNLKSDL